MFGQDEQGFGDWKRLRIELRTVRWYYILKVAKSKRIDAQLE
jgi:hypothetical protein